MADGLHGFETVVFKIKEILTDFASLLFLPICYLVLWITGHIWHYSCPGMVKASNKI